MAANTPKDEGFDLLAREVRSRMDDLTWESGNVAKHGGPAAATVDKILEGKKVRSDAYPRLCRALGWTVDSIARARRGEKPKLLSDEDEDRRSREGGRRASDQAADRISAVEERVGGLSREVRWIRELVERELP